MSPDPDDVVRVATGTMIAVELYKQALADDGIAGRVVGLDLTGSFGTALPDSVELWVHRADVPAAEAAVRRVEAGRHPAPSGDGGAT